MLARGAGTEDLAFGGQPSVTSHNSTLSPMCMYLLLSGGWVGCWLAVAGVGVLCVSGYHKTVAIAAYYI
eukprot:scaffold1567_cov106-Isochrysis_galbana.AAC.3